MLVSLTVGKVDAGLAILLTKDKRLIEFPSVLLPPGVSNGSIIDIQVSRNTRAEEVARQAFETLQTEIYTLFGQHSPKKPILGVRNATQTSVVLEWDPIDLATASLRSLALYRNGHKAGNIPNPTTHHSTKISGLAVDTEYTFHLVLRTSAGTYTSEKVTTRTHKMTDLSGITVCPGIMSPSEKEKLGEIIKRIGAKPFTDHVRIDTTHFVCTEGRGQGWERAQEMNIPIVRPEWLEACEQEERIVGVRNFYLGADVSMRSQRARPVSHMPPPPPPQNNSSAPAAPVGGSVTEVHQVSASEEQASSHVNASQTSAAAPAPTGPSETSSQGTEQQQLPHVDEKPSETAAPAPQTADPTIRDTGRKVNSQEVEGGFTSVSLE